MLAIGFLFVGCAIGLVLMNAYPTVWIGDEHLVITAFLFKRVKVPWADIIDVGAVHVPFGFVLVRARRITTFHKVYGLLYSRTLLPSFVIGPMMQDRDELLREIKVRARESRLR